VHAKSLFASSALTLVALLSANSAFAQAAQPAQVDEVVVTGTLISRSDANSPNPISVVTNQQIVEAGTLNITEVLKQDPALGVNSRSNTLTLNGAGASNVNLRNLGSNRTLALVNGRRLPVFSDPIGNSSQDTTILPSNLIQRVDVLRDGASTTYGADAVAGVVNFILRDKFDGFQTEAYYGQSEQGDGEAYRLSALMGKTWDRGSVVFSALYQDQDPILMSRRSWARPAIQTLASPVSANTYGSNNTPGGAILSAASGAQLACYPFAGGGVIPQTDANCPRYDSSVETSLTGGTTLRNFGLVARYDVTDKIRFSADVFQSRRESYNSISAAQILTSGLTGAFPAGFRVLATSTNNPFGQDVNIRWRPATYGSRPTMATTNQVYANFGLDGKLFDDRVTWNITQTYSQSDALIRTPNQINSVALNNLLNTAACAADRVCTGIGAVPNIANLLSGATRLTAAQQSYMFFTQTSDNKFSSAQTIATASGTLFKLPAGDVDLAVGYEHRKETGKITPDALTQQGVAIGSFVFPTDGQFSTNEAFGELNIPLVKDAPLMKDLSVDLQGRYSDFSNFGGAKTYKIGVNWTPIEGIRFRGGYGTSFRAPGVIELYGGGVGATSSIQDPCNSGAGGLRATNSAVNANCNALGVPANFVQSGTALPTRSGGNPALEPERGRTITFGVVFQPDYLPGLLATVDAYDIRIRDAIGAGNTQNNLNNCYADTTLAARSANSDDICFSFGNRQVNGQLDRILTRSINLQEVYTSGVDMNLRYRWQELPMVSGSFTADMRASYLRSYKQQGVQLANTFNGGVDGSSAFPRLRGNLTGTYSQPLFDIQWQVNYVDSIRDQFYGTSVPVVNIKGYSGVPTYFSHDLLVRVRPMDGLRVSVGVNNLFDKDPPYALVLTRNSLATVHDQVGRYYFMTIAKDW
jgi:iron complex outermembrane receptor protein